MSRLPFNVAGNSLTFYVKGRPYHLHKDHQNFDIARQHLLAPGTDHDAEMLVDLVDIRKGLERASFGAIQFDDETILWRGKPLTGVWVDRILAHRAAGEAFDHLWKALDKLVHNPTATAIERLPIFLDRVGLGFLPDGRFLAFKGVQADYHSAHENTDGTRFRHFVGDAPRMPREEVDPDPNQTCSTGLHVGAPGYVRGHYSGGSYALVLVAVDPVDVVSVPTDYQGEKMRVCGYEVIEHLDQSYSDELFGRLRTMTAVPVPTPAPAPAPFAALACVGDTITYSGDEENAGAAAGIYVVEDIDNSGDGYRLMVGTPSGPEYLDDDKITKLIRGGVEVRPVIDLEEDGIEPEDETSDYDRLKVGDVIEYEDDITGSMTYGRVEVLNPVQVRDVEGDLLSVDEDQFTRLVPENEITASMVVTKGALVRIEGHDFLHAGNYTIAGFEEEDSDEDQVDGASIFWAVLVDGRRLPIRNRNIMVASYKGEHLWPRTSISTQDAASLDGHDPRRDVVEASTPTVADEVDPYVSGAIQASKIVIERAEPGDLIETKQEGGWLPAGIYPVLRVAEYHYVVQTEHDGDQPVSNGRVVSITRRPWLRAEFGGTVTLASDPSSGVGAGRYQVTDLRLDGDTPQLQVRLVGCNGGNWWVDATRVTKAEPKA